MACSVALIFNWWNLFVRLADPYHHREAITSRPLLLLHAIGRQTTHARQTTVRGKDVRTETDQGLKGNRNSIRRSARGMTREIELIAGRSKKRGIQPRRLDVMSVVDRGETARRDVP